MSQGMVMLRRFWVWWKSLAQEIGDFQARVILTVFYFLVITPFGLAVHFLSDRLRLRPSDAASYWLERETHDTDLERSRSQGS